MVFSVDVQILCSPTPPFAAEQVERVVREVVARTTEIQTSSTCSSLEVQGRGTQEAARGLTLVIADDDLVRELNHRYRGVDSTTDVLAFGGMPEEFVEAPGATDYLGDVIISYRGVLTQAREHGHSAARELAILVAHGILHLLGHEHSTPAQRNAMWDQQEAILSRVWLCESSAGRDPESKLAS